MYDMLLFVGVTLGSLFGLAILGKVSSFTNEFAGSVWPQSTASDHKGERHNITYS